MHKSEKIKFPRVEELFTDVYDKPTQNLVEQEKYLLDHLKNYGSYYKLAKFEKWLKWFFQVKITTTQKTIK